MAPLRRASLALAGLLACAGCSSVHTERVVPAPPEAIWAVLTDAPGYETWNPVLYQVEGEFREGAELNYQMRQPDGTESAIQATVKKMLPGRELNQGGGVPGLLTFDHRYLLEPVDGGTRVVQHEEYRGVGVLFWDNSWVEPAYASVNEALGRRVAELAP